MFLGVKKFNKSDLNLGLLVLKHHCIFLKYF